MTKLTILFLSALLGVMWQTSAFAITGYTQGEVDARGASAPRDSKDDDAGEHEPECE